MDWDQILYLTFNCLFFLIFVIPFFILCIYWALQKPEQNYQTHEEHGNDDGNNYVDEENERNKKKRAIMAWYGYSWLINHDGNPHNDTFTSRYTPGTDTWKSQHHR